MKIDALKFGLAAGILWAVFLFVLTFIGMGTGYAAGFLQPLSSVYPGYQLSASGAFFGLIDAFIDAFVGFWLLIKIYNALL